VNETKNTNISIIQIEHSAHHLDLRAPNPSDPQSVVVARVKEIEIIRGWLNVSNKIQIV